MLRRSETRGTSPSRTGLHHIEEHSNPLFDICMELCFVLYAYYSNTAQSLQVSKQKWTEKIKKAEFLSLMRIWSQETGSNAVIQYIWIHVDTYLLYTCVYVLRITMFCI